MKKLFSLFIVVSAVFLFLQIVYGQEVPRVAVMEIIDNTETLNKKMLKTEEDQMRTLLIKKGKGKIQVISTAEQEQVIIKMQKESYQMNRDKNGQIALGKRMSAQEIFYTVISSFGTNFTVTSTLIDIKTGGNIDATSENFGGENIQQKLRSALAKNIDYLLSQIEEIEKWVEIEKKNSGDEEYCKKARQNNSPTGWNSYLKNYPKGICAAEAKETLDKQACAHAKKRNSIEIWQGYLRMFPEGSCKYEADTAIFKLKQQGERGKKNKEKDSEGRKMLEEWERSNR